MPQQKNRKSPSGSPSPNQTQSAEAVRAGSAGHIRVALGQPAETELAAGSLDPNFSRQAGPCSATAQLVRSLQPARLAEAIRGGLQSAAALLQKIEKKSIFLNL